MSTTPPSILSLRTIPNQLRLCSRIPTGHTACPSGRSVAPEHRQLRISWSM